MDYAYIFEEFLGEEKVEEEIQRYQREKEETGRQPQEKPLPSMDPADVGNTSLPGMIDRTREAFLDFWTTGELALTDSVLEITSLGRAIHQVSGTPILNPSGKEIDMNLSDVYREKFWNDEGFWDTAFEIEMAATIQIAGLDAKLIEEGTESGPDILIDENTPTWVECKRKRELSPQDERWNRLKRQFSKKLWNTLDIGDDGFVLNIESDDELGENDISELAGEAANLINSRGSSIEVSIANMSIRLEIIDYHEGERLIDIHEREPMRISKNNEEVNERFQRMGQNVSPNPLAEIAQTDILSHLEKGPETGEVIPSLNVMFTDEGKVRVANAHIIEWNVPNQTNYVNGVKQSVDSATSNLSGYSPSLAFIHVPHSRLNEMRKEGTKYRGEPVSQHKRLEISLKGVLGNHDTLNGIVITSRMVDNQDNKVVSVRYGENHLHIDPKDELSQAVVEFLEEDLTAEIEWKDEFEQGDQQSD